MATKAVDLLLVRAGEITGRDLAGRERGLEKLEHAFVLVEDDVRKRRSIQAVGALASSSISLRSAEHGLRAAGSNPPIRFRTEA